jgi:hypothetical protein
LFEKGRTIQWADLPERLWATTGESVPNVQKFEQFGRLRNGIQHFGATPETNVGYETLKFVFEVIDRFINASWDLFAVDYDEDYDPYIYFVSPLVHRGIPFLVLREAAEAFKD